MKVSEVLAQNRKHRTEGNSVSKDDVVALERTLGIRLIDDHRQFLLLGGLDDLRFAQNLLSPDEVVCARTYVSSDLVPFADDGTGDVFCWRQTDSHGHEILRWNHETGKSEEYCDSFVKCLKMWRF